MIKTRKISVTSHTLAGVDPKQESQPGTTNVMFFIHFVVEVEHNAEDKCKETDETHIANWPARASSMQIMTKTRKTKRNHSNRLSKEMKNSAKAATRRHYLGDLGDQKKRKQTYCKIIQPRHPQRDTMREIHVKTCEKTQCKMIRPIHRAGDIMPQANKEPMQT